MSTQPQYGVESSDRAASCIDHRPKMLMISPEAPWPATTGGLVRIGALLEQMARHFCVTFVSPRGSGQVLPEDTRIDFRCPELPQPDWLRRTRALIDPRRPFHVSIYSSSDIAALVRRELASSAYDLVFGHFIYCLEYLAGSRVPVVIDQQNVDRLYWQNKMHHSAFPLNLFAGWNMRKTMAYETRRLRQIWGYISVSDEDRIQTRGYADGIVEHFWVAPNGVDTRRFQPAAEKPQTSGALVLGYLGSMDLQMNIDAVQRFCATLLPAIRQAVHAADLRFVVIGRKPSAAIRELAAKTPGMVITGTVEDVVPWLQRLDILVCPLRIGAGTKLKVAEAMSCGLPVVGTSLAFAGLPGQSGEHFIQADTDEEFVTAVRGLAAEPDRRRTMGRNARALAIECLEWDAIGRQLALDIKGALVVA